MTLQRIIARFGQHQWRERLGVLALGLGLIAVGCVLVGLPELPVPTWSQASAAAVAGAQAAAPAGLGAAHSHAAATFARHENGVEAPRACAPDQGITEACTYN